MPPATQYVQFAEAARRHLADALLLVLKAKSPIGSRRPGKVTIERGGGAR